MKLNKSVELVKDIFAFAVILTRFGYSDSVANQSLFVEMLNEAGFRTVTGMEFTPQNFHIMIRRLHPRVKSELQEEFADVFERMNFKGESPLASIEC